MWPAKLIPITLDTVKQYRRLDDQIITRLNRAQAQLRDSNRLSTPGPSSWTRHTATTNGQVQMDGAEGMCARMWGEMMGETLRPIRALI